MRHIRLVSFALTVAGIALVAAGLVFDLSATALLIGLMLIVAGGVKIVMVSLWHTVAGFGAPLTGDDPATGATIEPARGRKARS